MVLLMYQYIRLSKKKKIIAYTDPESMSVLC